LPNPTAFININATFNSGAMKWQGKYVLIVRVEGVDRKSFFAVAESPNGIDQFRFWDYPLVMPETNEPDTNVYDMRIVQHEDGWIYGLFCTERKAPIKTKHGWLHLAHGVRMTECFEDKENGGVIWTVDYQGRPADTRKQTYALAFAIYAFCEYHTAAGDQAALEKAKTLFSLIEKHCVDRVHGGYWEALDADWQLVEDVRLSEKDANEKKSMNTHLHVLEGYANLARVWPEARVREALHKLLRSFMDQIIDPRHGHFNLFFDERWNVRSIIVSFGHDIEGSWLLEKAAQVCGDADLRRQARGYSVRLVEAALEGLDADGGLMTEKNLMSGHLDTDKHWWPQAEALVGLLNAYEITHNEKYLELCLGVWSFIKSKTIDFEQGEWYWKVNRRCEPYPDDEKIGFWKCPYHNSRACLEVRARLDQFQ
jgi:mannobiose 2-epimerase